MTSHFPASLLRVRRNSRALISWREFCSVATLIICVLSTVVAFGQTASSRTSSVAEPSVDNSRSSSVSRTDPFALRARRNSATGSSDSSSTDSESPSSASRVSQASSELCDVANYLDGRSESCEVLRLSGASGATLRLAGGERVVSLTELSSLELSVGESFLAGVESFELGRRLSSDLEYRRAADFFEEARRDSARRLEKEWATAKIVETLVALGELDRAAEEFFLLCRVDPYTPYLSSIPLRWLNKTPGGFGVSSAIDQTAESQLLGTDGRSGSRSPCACLLAASILLNAAGERGDAARQTMRALVACQAPDDSVDAEATCRLVALLASAQLWRRSILTNPKADEVAGWERRLALFDESVRLGPSALVAQGLNAIGREEEAARLYLEIALLGSRDRVLSTYGTVEASATLERLGRAEESRRLRAAYPDRFSR